MAYIIVFGSFVHGSGKSFLSKKLKEYLENKGYKVYYISAGELFRKIALEEGKNIDDFAKEMNENIEKGLEIDLKIDRLILDEINRNKDKYDFIIIDSNLAPYYIQGKNVLRIYVYASLDVIAERVLRNKRTGDKEFKDINEVKKTLLERSLIDKKRYEKLARVVKDEFWRKVYESYGKNIFDLKVNNNEDWKKVLRNLIEKIEDIMKKSPSAENDEGLELR